jgi:hypothetical protein
MRRVEKHLAGIGGLTNVYKTVLTNPESKKRLEDPAIDGRIL